MSGLTQRTASPTGQAEGGPYDGKSESAAGGRFDGIDVLRGLSIIAVLLHHINLRFLINDVSFKTALPDQLGRILFWNGANGVTVFFAISGFLITTTVIRRWGSLRAVRSADFYKLRFARIVPLLLALLAVLSVLHLSHVKGFEIPPERASLGRALLAAITFHINWLEAVRGYLPANWDVLWSLSVEEVFYIFFPLFCWMTRGRRALMAVLGIFVVLGPFARTVMTKNEYWAECGYLSCMDAIALGCLAAMLAVVFRASRELLWAMRLAGVLLIVLVMAARPLGEWLQLYRTGLNVTALALGTCLMMIAVVQENRRGGRPTALLRWFGRQSYEIYLTHMFVIMWAVQFYLLVEPARKWAPAWYLMMLVLAGVLGGIVARWYSEPMNKKLRSSLRLRTAM